ncbi:hypothetical protein AB1K54_15955 [Microbacterium sp. BWT-B31]|uniref:hypothetical protein n=1 Tax=Microbacterium sp. BWT-B31 TaxID=3232072 RepID=UPI0035291D23
MSDPTSAFVTAVSRLPTFVGLAWRAAGFELAAPFTSGVPLAASRDLRVATENFRATGAHLFLCTSARDISMLSAHPADQEIVLLPDARLVPVTSFREVGGLRIQVVLEQPASGTALPHVPDDAAIGELVRSARATAPAEIHQPGRYGA